MLQSDSTPAVNAGTVGASGWSTLSDYCFKNPFLVLWNVALILGGLITFGHFASIRYFPDLDIKTASSFLLGVALLGVSLLLVLAATLIVPSYLIRREVWIPYFLSQTNGTTQQSERISVEIEKSRRVPFMTLSLLHGLAAFFFWIFLASFFISDSLTSYRITMRIMSVVAFSFTVVTLFFWGYWWSRHDPYSTSATASRTGHNRKAQHVTFVSIWWLLYPGYMLLIVLSVGKLDKNDIISHLFIMGFAAFFIIANTRLATTNFSSPRSYWKVPAMAALLTVIYLSIPSNPLNIARVAFTSLAIGDLSGSQFVVKRPTCDAVNLIVPGACEVASDVAGCIRPKSLANRIGGEYLLVLAAPRRPSPMTKPDAMGVMTNLEIRVPIPKAEVLAWGAVDTNNSPWVPCARIQKIRSEVDIRKTPGS